MGLQVCFLEFFFFFCSKLIFLVEIRVKVIGFFKLLFVILL